MPRLHIEMAKVKNSATTDSNIHHNSHATLLLERISNRHAELLETLLTYAKQTSPPTSNRHRFHVFSALFLVVS